MNSSQIDDIAVARKIERAVVERIRQSRRYNIGDYQYFVWPYKGIEPIEPQELRYLVRHLAALVPSNTDMLLTFMTDGDILAVSLAQELDLPIIICRDHHYHMVNPTRICQRTAYFRRDLYFSRPPSQQNVSIVDAIISTGATMRAAADALGEVGCDIVGLIAAVERSEHMGCKLLERQLGIRPSVQFSLTPKPNGELHVRKYSP